GRWRRQMAIARREIERRDHIARIAHQKRDAGAVEKWHRKRRKGAKPAIADSDLPEWLADVAGPEDIADILLIQNVGNRIVDEAGGAREFAENIVEKRAAR